MKPVDEQTGVKNRQLEITGPYHSSCAARAVGQDLRIGDYVRIIGLDDKYEVMDVFYKRGSVRVRRNGRRDQLYLPWWHVRSWEEESSK